MLLPICYNILTTQPDYNYVPPTREFYEQSERAAVIRNICLRALDDALATMYSDGKNEETATALLVADSQLDDLGITPNIHSIPTDAPDAASRKEELNHNPDMISEWVAGQIRRSMPYFLSGVSIDSLKEYDEGFAPHQQAIAVDFRAMGPKAQDFFIYQHTAGILQGFLDHEAGPSNLDTQS